MLQLFKFHPETKQVYLIALWIGDNDKNPLKADKRFEAVPSNDVKLPEDPPQILVMLSTADDPDGPILDYLESAKRKINFGSEDFLSVTALPSQIEEACRSLTNEIENNETKIEIDEFAKSDLVTQVIKQFSKLIEQTNGITSSSNWNLENLVLHMESILGVLNAKDKHSKRPESISCWSSVMTAELTQFLIRYHFPKATESSHSQGSPTQRWLPVGMRPEIERLQKSPFDWDELFSIVWDSMRIVEESDNEEGYIKVEPGSEDGQLLRISIFCSVKISSETILSNIEDVLNKGFSQEPLKNKLEYLEYFPSPGGSDSGRSYFIIKQQDAS
ncbi:MAG TPA: hypothetical protein DD473_23535 [Planctomycetaceae bacterium]|nr:hypothetical protein [Planctomycetaceae bacterium]